MASFAKAGNKPIVEVCTAKYRLCCFQKEHTVNYKICQRGARENEVRSSRAQLLEVPIVLGEIVAVHVFSWPNI